MMPLAGPPGGRASTPLGESCPHNEGIKEQVGDGKDAHGMLGKAGKKGLLNGITM